MFKKAILVVAALTYSVTPAFSDEAALNKRIDDLETRLKALELIVPFLRAMGEGVKKNTENGAVEGKDDLQKPIPPKLVVHLDSVKQGPKGFDGSPGVKLSISISNPTDNDIAILNASISLEDKTGTKLANIKWEKNQAIGPNKIASQVGTYSDGYDHWAESLLSLDPSLVVIDLIVHSIAFKDGRVEKYD